LTFIIHIIKESKDIQFDYEFLLDSIKFFENFDLQIYEKLKGLNDSIDFKVVEDIDFDLEIEDFEFEEWEMKPPKDEEIYSPLQCSLRSFLEKKSFVNFSNLLKLLSKESEECQKYYVSYSMNVILCQHSLDDYLQFTNGNGEDFQLDLITFLNSTSNIERKINDSFLLVLFIKFNEIVIF
jgi:hypothetical protein